MTEPNSAANTHQVGGTHYKTTFQHWDLAAKLDMGYFEGQITKYVTRHRNKKGKEDAEKALHFARKMHELAKGGRGPRHRQIDVPTMTTYAEANMLHPLEYACIMSVCSWQTIFDLPGMEEKLERLIATYYPGELEQPKRCEPCRSTGLVHCAHPTDCGGPWTQQEPDGAPTGAYVDQGRDI